MKRAFVLQVALLGAACRTAAPVAPPPTPVVTPPAAAATRAPIIDSDVAPPPPLVVDDGRPVEVTLKVEAVAAGVQSFVESGQTLHTGDQVAFHVGVSAPAFVYVGLAAANGDHSVLFPIGDVPALAPVMPGPLQRVPPEGKWFRLDKTTGLEDVFVYASKRELTHEDVLGWLKKDRAALSSARGKRKAKKPKGPKVTISQQDVPSALTAETRGLELDDAPTAGAGVTRAHFLITHHK